MTAKTLYQIAGFVFLGLAFIGVLLPLVPATPFVLLAAACFARSSEKWYRWLLASNLFGPMIRNWQQRRCVDLRIKVVALLSMLVLGGVSVFVAIDHHATRWVGGALMLIGALVILSLPTCPRQPESCSAEADGTDFKEPG